jgi:hypothetical protein
MLKNNDLSLNKIMPIEIKLEETFTCKQGEKNNLDKMILTLHRKGKLGIEDIADAAKQLYK